MKRFALHTAVLGIMLVGLATAPASAWDRGEFENFATIPSFTPSGPGAACPDGATSCTSDIEGVTVGPDGTVYTPSFGFNSDGALSGYGERCSSSRPMANLSSIFPSGGRTPT
jgi:hypothetical protein